MTASSSTDPEPPLVSCLMVSRGDFFPAALAIDCYRRQTYPNRELVIVSARRASDVEAFASSLGDPSIRFVQSDDMPLGDLRNASVAAARGALLCLWDDDDLYHPRRIEVQARALIDAGADAHFLLRLFLWWPKRRLLALAGERAWENTMLARREALPLYPSRGIREDTELVRALGEKHPVSFSDAPELYCYVVHDRNICDEAHFEFLVEGADIVFEDYDAELARLAPELPVRRYQVRLEAEGPPAPLLRDQAAGVVETVSGRSFGAEFVKIDGVRFLDCRFDGTQFAYIGGRVPEFENCKFADVRFTFGGSAHNSLQLLRLLVSLEVIDGI